MKEDWELFTLTWSERLRVLFGGKVYFKVGGDREPKDEATDILTVSVEVAFKRPWLEKWENYK